MPLANKNVGDPHVAAHNEERAAINANENAIGAHALRTDNPHATTKTQVGLGNVDNTSDANKPVSIAQAAADALHASRTDNPHSVTRAQVGLGNADNTSDVNKPTSTAQAASILASMNTHLAATDPHAQYGGPRGLIATAGDINTYVNPGAYRVSSPTGITSANMPVAKVGILIVDTYSYGGSTLTQTYWEDTGETYTRNCISGTWKPWTRIDNIAQDALIARNLMGTGQPNGVVTAPIGAKYIDTAKTAGAIEWYKNASAGNTGWVYHVGKTGMINANALVKVDEIQWGANLLTIRLGRTQDVVSLYIQVTVGTTPVSPQTLLTLPAGFQPVISQYAAITWSGVTNYQSITSSAGPITVYSLTAGAVLRGSGSWQTADVWPADLVMPPPP